MNSRSRSFGFICYPDSTTYDCDALIQKATNLFNEYGYILHDRDIDKDGCIKKPHYHFYGRFVNPRNLSFIQNELAPLSSNQIDIVSSFKGAIRYLIHANEPSKVQYDPLEVISNIQNLSDKYFDICEAEQVIKLIQLRKSGSSLLELVDYSRCHDCYSVFRRNYSIIKEAAHEEYFKKLKGNKDFILPDGFEYVESNIPNF